MAAFASRRTARARSVSFMGCSPTPSVPGELPIGDPVRAGRLGFEAVGLVLLVRLEVALQPVRAGGVLVAALPGDQEDVTIQVAGRPTPNQSATSWAPPMPTVNGWRRRCHYERTGSP